MSQQKTKDWHRVREESEQKTEAELDAAESEAEDVESLSRSELEARLEVAEQKAQENWDKATRATAELENIRKRAERDVANAHRYGLEKFIQSLIPVVDSLQQAMALVQDMHGEMGEGIALTLQLLLTTLEKHGVQEINPEKQPFNPQEHEAMSMQPSAEVEPNSVLTVFQKGYKLNDRVIRPARVIVSKAMG